MNKNELSLTMKSISAHWRAMSPEEQFQIAISLAGNRHCSTFISLMNNCALEIYPDELNKYDKITKGYGFDSLCWRYKCAREQQALYEIRSGADEEKANKMANRDIMRFAQILDDLIGEHY